MTEAHRKKIKEILTELGYSDIKFEDGYLIVTNSSGIEVKITEKKCIMTFLFAKSMSSKLPRS